MLDEKIFVQETISFYRARIISACDIISTCCHEDFALQRALNNIADGWDDREWENLIMSIAAIVNTYLSTQCAAVIAQFSFNNAAPHLCRYVCDRHWRNEICKEIRHVEEINRRATWSICALSLVRNKMTVDVKDRHHDYIFLHI